MRKHLVALAATLALTGTLRAQDTTPQDDKKPDQRAQDDSNVNPPPTPTKDSVDHPEVGGKSAGGGLMSNLHLPWSINDSPSWTQDRNFPNTRFWRLDYGAVEVESWYQVKVHRPKASGPGSNGTEHLWLEEIEVGILPGIQLDVYENFIKEPGGKVEQEGNQIEFRIAPFEYGTVPLNPTLYLEWHPTAQGHPDGQDRWEIRLLIGGSPIPRLYLVGNAGVEMETSGNRLMEWGFNAGAAYEVIEGVLRLGVETFDTFEWSTTHQSAGDGFDGEIGPDFMVRPLAALNPDWGHWLKISGSFLFGLNEGPSSERLRAIIIVGCQF
ncbi:MAG TPA: hypothetical protein VFF73_18090 [Planctomycetota bacterium]|nr:hypothetical protein [Planctomycetota bacterium]